MARTLQEIFDSLVTAKNNKAELDGINTTSPISIWQNLFWVVAAIMYLLEVSWDNFSKEIDTKVAEAFPGTLEWYRKEALLWQYGDTPEYTNNKWQYPVIDTTKQLITMCAVTEGFNSVIIKVAKGTPDAPVKLSTAELSDFNIYMLTYRKFAGISLLTYTQNSDKLKIYYDIYYKPFADLDTIKASVAVAINTYLNSLSFTAPLSITRLTDAIQNVEGVTDPFNAHIFARTDGGTFAVVVRTYSPLSGFFSIDEDFPLSATLTYLPDL